LTASYGLATFGLRLTNFRFALPAKDNPMSFQRNAFIFLSVSAALAAGVFAQPSFSLKTNSDFPTLGTDFGYKFGKIEPFIGVSNYSMRVDDRTTYSPDQFGDGDTSYTRATVFITSVGVRLGFRDEGVKPYLFANMYKLFTIVDIKSNTKKEDDQVESLYSPFGFGAGFGADYTVAKGFSVFGEYGFRALFPNSTITENNSSTQKRTSEFTAMFSVLSGAAGIRFYF
jgi:hypothetical protein